MQRVITLIVILFFPYFLLAQIYGCTDLEAKNFDAKATLNDGSCRYKNAKMKPIFSTDLSKKLHETSGLILYEEKLYTLNDDSDSNLYRFDQNGTNIESIPLKNVKNQDWEALAQDSLYIYVGDFGNNVSGNRRDLKILKIEKQSLLMQNPRIETIAFSFENQYDFDAKRTNKTNFDCETILVTRDSLFLLTKEWKSKKTRLYVLPKTSGTHLAKFKAELNVKGLITDGTLLEDQRVIVLCGYSKKLQPFLYLLNDYQGNDFFSGNKRKIKLKMPFHQIEGIASQNGLQYFLTNEKFQIKPIVSVKQKLHVVDLTKFVKK